METDLHNIVYVDENIFQCNNTNDMVNLLFWCS